MPVKKKKNQITIFKSHVGCERASRVTQSPGHRASRGSGELRVFGRSALLHQKVHHALGLDEEVAAEKENPEDDGKWEHAEHCDLHEPRHELLALVDEERVDAAGDRRGGGGGGKVAAGSRAFQLVLRPVQDS